MGCQTSKPEDVQPPPTPPADADKAKSPPTPQTAPADEPAVVLEDAFGPAPAPTPSGFARALGVAQDPASPPPAPKSSSTRGRSLSPSSSRGDLVEDGKTASPPSTPLPPRTDPPSPTSAGSLQAPAFCVDDDVTTPIKLPPQPEVASPFDPARPRRPPTVECDADAAARNVQALLAALGTPTKRVATKPPPAPDDDTTRFARQALEASGRDSEDASSAAKALATHGSGLADGLALLRKC